MRDPDALLYLLRVTLLKIPPSASSEYLLPFSAIPLSAD
jgi:hypothetical protein